MIKYFSKIEETCDGIKLQAFCQSKGGVPRLLNERQINKRKNMENVLKEAASAFPLSLQITLEAEEMAFNNSKNEKGEKEHCVALDESGESLFSYVDPPCNKNGHAAFLTSYACVKEKLNQYKLFCDAGFLPYFFLRHGRLGHKDLRLLSKSTDKGFFMLLAYYQGVLTAWIMGEAKEKNKLQKELLAYLKAFNLPVAEKISASPLEGAATQAVELPYLEKEKRDLVFKKLKKVLGLSLGGLALFLFLAVLVGNVLSALSLQKNVNTLLTKLKKFENLLGKNSQDIQKKEIKTVAITHVVSELDKALRKGSKYSVVRRILLNGNRVKLYIKEEDLIKINKLKERISENSLFVDLRIEEGIEKDDKRIVFRVKK